MDKIDVKPAGEKHLRCTLTQDEFNRAADELANALSRKTEAENEMQSYRDQHKSRMTGIDADISRLQPVVAQRAEWRKVKCEKILNFTLGTVEILRIDTGEIIEKRQMYEDEKQLQLSMEEEILAEDADIDVFPDADVETAGSADTDTDPADHGTREAHQEVINQLVFTKERAESEYGGPLSKRWYLDAKLIETIDQQYVVQTAREMGGTARANDASVNHNPFLEGIPEFTAWAEGWNAVHTAMLKLRVLDEMDGSAPALAPAYANMTMAQLKKAAKERGITVPPKSTTDDVIALLLGSEGAGAKAA